MSYLNKNKRNIIDVDKGISIEMNLDDVFEKITIIRDKKNRIDYIEIGYCNDDFIQNGITIMIGNLTEKGFNALNNLTRIFIEKN